MAAHFHLHSEYCDPDHVGDARLVHDEKKPIVMLLSIPLPTETVELHVRSPVGGTKLLRFYARNSSADTAEDPNHEALRKEFWTATDGRKHGLAPHLPGWQHELRPSGIFSQPREETWAREKEMSDHLDTDLVNHHRRDIINKRYREMVAARLAGKRKRKGKAAEDDDEPDTGAGDDDDDDDRNGDEYNTDDEEDEEDDGEQEDNEADGDYRPGSKATPSKRKPALKGARKILPAVGRRKKVAFAQGSSFAPSPDSIPSLDTAQEPRITPSPGPAQDADCTPSPTVTATQKPLIETGYVRAADKLYKFC